MTVTARIEDHDPASDDAPDARSRVTTRGVAFLTLGMVLAGVVVRFSATSDLWLDEALSVHIAGLPLGDIPDALRRDGHPPLYYFILHGWMEVFGDGDVAVRSLSGLIAVATLPLAWWAGRRHAGRLTGLLALVFLASSPFAARYATEARMYSLVVLLVFVGWLLIDAAFRNPSLPVLAGIAAVTGCLLLTHYWTFYLVGATAVALMVPKRRRPPERRRADVRVLGAMAIGSLLFLPWLSGFLFQLEHTGTPWAVPTRPAAIVMDTLQDLGGGITGEARLLGWALGGLALFGVLARRSADGWRVELDFHTNPRARPEAFVIAATLTLAAGAGFVTGTGYATRYFAVVFPLLLLLVALGAARLPSPWVRFGVVATLVILGFSMAVHQAVTERTQGGEIARVIASDAETGDVVAFCPDQLGPAVDRVLPERFVERPFPEGSDAARVDWVDYEARNSTADPAAFAHELVAEAGSHDIWLVWRSGYRTLDGKCGQLAGALRSLRHAERVVAPSDVFEPAELVRYPAPG